MGYIAGFALVMSMSATAAFAGSITITRDQTYDGTNPRTYSAYKVFDADTRVGSVNGQADTGTIYILATAYDASTTYYTQDSTTGAFTQATVADATAFAAGTFYTAVADADTAIAYSMAIDSPWLSVMQASAQTWFDVVLAGDGSKYAVTLKNGVINNAETAQAIAAYLNSNIPSGATATTVTPGTAATVANGYYLLVASDGATNLTLVTADVTIVEKNTYLTTSKTASAVDVNVGDIVTYTATVTIPADTKLTPTTNPSDADYVILHDTMASVLDFKKDVAGTINKDTDEDGKDDAFSDFTASYATTGGWTTSDGCTFELKIPVTSAVLGKTITFTYTAEVTSAAADDTGYVNSLFGEKNGYKTTPDTPTVYTFDFDLDKQFDNLASEDSETYAATFELFETTRTYYTNEGKTEVSATETEYFTDAKSESAIQFIKDSTGYVKADSDDTTGASKTLTVNGKDIINVRGLKEGTYYLVEKTTSTGYNLLTEPVIVTITDTSSDTTISHSVSYRIGEDGTAATGTVTVQNNSGTVLPSTGGIGTTIFYVVGSILVVAAGVLLITKKRMSREG